MNREYYITPEGLNKLLGLINKYSMGGGWKEVKPAESGLLLTWPKIEGMDPLQVVLQNGSEHNAGVLLGIYNRYTFYNEETRQNDDRAAISLMQTLTRMGEPR